MAIEQAILTWIHITCAAIWVGGSLFIGAVFAPILKKNGNAGGGTSTINDQSWQAI